MKTLLLLPFLLLSACVGSGPDGRYTVQDGKTVLATSLSLSDRYFRASRQ